MLMMFGEVSSERSVRFRSRVRMPRCDWSGSCNGAALECCYRRCIADSRQNDIAGPTNYTQLRLIYTRIILIFVQFVCI